MTITNKPDSFGLETAIRLVRLPAVIDMVGLGKSEIYSRIQKNAFPAPVKLGIRAVAWRAADVERWVLDRATTTGRVQAKAINATPSAHGEEAR